MKLSNDQWHTLLRALAIAEKSALARTDWSPAERACTAADYNMMFVELFKQAPSSVRSALLNNVVHPGSNKR